MIKQGAGLHLFFPACKEDWNNEGLHTGNIFVNIPQYKDFS